MTTLKTRGLVKVILLNRLTFFNKKNNGLTTTKRQTGSLSPNLTPAVLYCVNVAIKRGRPLSRHSATVRVASIMPISNLSGSAAFTPAR